MRKNDLEGQIRLDQMYREIHEKKLCGDFG